MTSDSPTRRAASQILQEESENGATHGEETLEMTHSLSLASIGQPLHTCTCHRFRSVVHDSRNQTRWIVTGSRSVHRLWWCCGDRCKRQHRLEPSPRPRLYSHSNKTRGVPGPDEAQHHRHHCRPKWLDTLHTVIQPRLKLN